MKKRIIELYKSSLNKDSKFYKEDLADFVNKLSSKKESELPQLLANLMALTGKDKAFNSLIKKEQNKMLRGGMYEVSNMKAKNALS